MIEGAPYPKTLALTSLLVSACGTAQGTADARNARCDWPIERTTPAGEIEIGTGNGTFEPMPETLSFITGSQTGALLVAHARMSGLEPGNPTDLFSPDNPLVKFSAVLADGSVLERECPSTVGFVASYDGGYERARSYNFEFLPRSRAEAAFDTEVTLIVEIIDRELRYARDERTVFASTPTGWFDAGPAAPSSAD